MSNQLILSLALRSFGPPLFALIVLVCWRQSSASTKRMVWLLSFVGLAFLPLALIKMPAIQVIKDSPTIQQSVAPQNLLSAAPEPQGKLTQTSEPVGNIGDSTNEVLIRQMHNLPSSNLMGIITIAIGIWLCGAFTILVQWLVGCFRLTNLELQPVQDSALCSELSAACEKMGLHKEPLLSMSTRVLVPMVYGHWHPRLVLPVDARDWDPEMRQAIFLHECAHIRRWDWLGLAFARFVTIAYWFNPLVWLASKQFRAECEAAADDSVLTSGVSPTFYANELLRIATEMQPATLVGCVAIMEDGSLKSRIGRLLEKNRSRQAASPIAISVSLAASGVLASLMGLTYQTIEGQVLSHNGFADLGDGHHVRIVAIIQSVGKKKTAWNMRGEVLPNGFPLPEELESLTSKDQSPESNQRVRYVVFGQNFHGTGITSADNVGPMRNAPPSLLQTVQSNQPGMGFYVSRVDGETLSVASILASGSQTGSIHCSVAGTTTEKIDEVHLNHVQSFARKTPVEWSMKSQEHIEWVNKNQTIITEGPATPANPKGFTKRSRYLTNFEVNVPEAWKNKDLLIEATSPTATRRCAITTDRGLAQVTLDIEAQTIQTVTISLRALCNVTFDNIPLAPNARMARTHDLDGSILNAPGSTAPGALVGIADLSHPEWGYWKPNGTKVSIAQVGMAHARQSYGPTGIATRRLGLLFRSGLGVGDRITASDVSGVLLCSSISTIYTSNGTYDLLEVFVNPTLRSSELFARVPLHDSVVQRVNLIRLKKDSMDKQSADFFSNRIAGEVSYFKFSPRIRVPGNGIDQSLRFMYGNKPAPLGAVSSYSTDWEDGAVGIEATQPYRVTGAEVLRHGYATYRYSDVALWPHK